MCWHCVLSGLGSGADTAHIIFAARWGAGGFLSHVSDFSSHGKVLGRPAKGGAESRRQVGDGTVHSEHGEPRRANLPTTGRSKRISCFEFALEGCFQFHPAATSPLLQEPSSVEPSL